MGAEAFFALGRFFFMVMRRASAQEHGAIMAYYGKKRSRFFNLFFGIFGFVVLIGWIRAFTSNAVPEGASLMERLMVLPGLVQGILFLFAISFLRIMLRNPNDLRDQLERGEYQVMDVLCRDQICANANSGTGLDNQKVFIKVYDHNGDKIASNVVVAGRAAYDHGQKALVDMFERIQSKKSLVRESFSLEEVPVLLIVPNKGNKRYGLPKNIV